MPLARTNQSGLFTTLFKEDAFYLDFDEQNLLFTAGARTEQSIELPFYYIDKAYYEKRKQVETLGLEGSVGRVEVYVQYATLPLLDPKSLADLREEIVERIKAARETFLERQSHPALFYMLKLQLCDEPIVFFDYQRADYSLRIKARAPILPERPVSTQTKRGRATFFREYEDLLCSKAVAYALNAFETLPFLQEVMVTLVRLEASPVEGLTVVEEQNKVTSKKEKGWELRRLAPLQPTETPEERKKREAEEKKLLRQQQKEEEKRKKEFAKTKRQLELTTRTPDGWDELFDGSLPHESVLLAARIPRQGFMDLNRSKASYSALQALQLFELRYEPQEEEAVIAPVEPFFQS